MNLYSIQTTIHQTQSLTVASSFSISAALTTIGPRTAYSMALTFGLSVSMVSTLPLDVAIDLLLAVEAVTVDVMRAAPPFTSTLADITRGSTDDSERRQAQTESPPASHIYTATYDAEMGNFT